MMGLQESGLGTGTDRKRTILAARCALVGLLALVMAVGPGNVGGESWNVDLASKSNTGGDARGVFVLANRAYVADGMAGLRIFNVSNPAAPALLGSFRTSGTASAVYVANNLAYLACGTSFGLQILDVSNPAQPTRRGFYDTPGEALGIRVAGSLAYLADMRSGLRIVNVGNPALPTSRGSYRGAGSARGVHVMGVNAYVAAMRNGLQIVNVTNPSLPTLRGSYVYPTAYPEAVFVWGSSAYVADSYWGLKVVNVSNPSAPTLRGSYATPEGAHGVFVSTATAYVTWGTTNYPESGGVSILEVNNPAAPVLRGSYTGGARAAEITVAGSYVYAAAGSEGLWILRYAGPGTRPAAPANLLAQAVSAGQINLSWSDNSSYETGYLVERKTTATATWSQIATLPANTSSFQNKGLTRNTQYHYRIRAYNAAGASLYSNTAYARTFDTAPATPTSLVARATSSTQITLNWRDNSSNETGFEIEINVAGNGPWTRIGSVGPNVRTYRSKGLWPTVLYGYRVRALNSGGYSLYSNESWTTTLRRNSAARPAWTLYP